MRMRTMRLLVGTVLALGLALGGCESGHVTIHGFVISTIRAPSGSTSCGKLGSAVIQASRLVSGVSLTFTDQEGTVLGTAITGPAGAVTLAGGCEVRSPYTAGLPKTSAYSVRFDYGGIPQSFGPITVDQLESVGYRLNLRIEA
jgi:hypothetical protein